MQVFCTRLFFAPTPHGAGGRSARRPAEVVGQLGVRDPLAGRHNEDLAVNLAPHERRLPLRTVPAQALDWAEQRHTRDVVLPACAGHRGQRGVTRPVGDDVLQLRPGHDDAR